MRVVYRELDDRRLVDHQGGTENPHPGPLSPLRDARRSPAYPSPRELSVAPSVVRSHFQVVESIGWNRAVRTDTILAGLGFVTANAGPGVQRLHQRDAPLFHEAACYANFEASQTGRARMF